MRLSERAGVVQNDDLVHAQQMDRAGQLAGEHTVAGALAMSMSVAPFPKMLVVKNSGSVAVGSNRYMPFCCATGTAGEVRSAP